MKNRRPELLIPASSLEVLKTAVVFGADAVYIGGEAFGLRAKAKNFSREEMEAGILFAHEHGVKVYILRNRKKASWAMEGVGLIAALRRTVLPSLMPPKIPPEWFVSLAGFPSFI